MNAILTLTALGIIAMMAEILRIRKQVLIPLMIGGLALCLGLVLNDWNTGYRYYHDMMFFDNYAVAFSALIVGATLIWFLLSGSFINTEHRQTDYTALVSFATAGAVIMVSHSDLTMLFLGIEILSIPMYVLSASNKSDLKSNESGFKYFLMGSFATGFLLFGLALVYGGTGSFNLQEIRSAIPGLAGSQLSLVQVGAVLMIVGLGFKVAAAPFHFWAPDVYDGAPSAVTAFMATVVKTAAFAAFLRVFLTAFAGLHETWTPVLAVMSAVSILGGNLIAVYQTSLKRMLAFSSIAHAGYMLMALVALNGISQGALLLYLAAYAAATLGLFAIVITLSENNNESVHALKGFSKIHPAYAAAISVLTLSMAGIPPVAGFFAKYYVFTAALQSGYSWLVILAVIGSLVGVYYYFRIIIAMYQHADRDSVVLRVPVARQIVLWICVAVTVLLGLTPGFLASIV